MKFDIKNAKEVCQRIKGYEDPDGGNFADFQAAEMLPSAIARIEELEADCENLLKALAMSGKTVIVDSSTQATKIEELKNALVEATAKNNYYEKAISRGGCSWFNLGGSARIAYCDKAREQLQKEGLI